MGTSAWRAKWPNSSVDFEFIVYYATGFWWQDARVPFGYCAYSSNQGGNGSAKGFNRARVKRSGMARYGVCQPSLRDPCGTESNPFPWVPALKCRAILNDPSRDQDHRDEFVWMPGASFTCCHRVPGKARLPPSSPRDANRATQKKLGRSLALPGGAKLFSSLEGGTVKRTKHFSEDLQRAKHQRISSNSQAVSLKKVCRAMPPRNGKRRSRKRWPAEPLRRDVKSYGFLVFDENSVTTHLRQS